MLLLLHAVEIQGSRFESNLADSGGAIAVDGQPSVQIRNCSFRGNTAFNAELPDESQGGAVYQDDSLQLPACHINISTSNFTANKAMTGGALSFVGANVTITGVQLVGNIAGSSGGALAVGGKTGGSLTGSDQTLGRLQYPVNQNIRWTCF